MKPCSSVSDLESPRETIHLPGTLEEDSGFHIAGAKWFRNRLTGGKPMSTRSCERFHTKKDRRTGMCNCPRDVQEQKLQVFHQQYKDENSQGWLKLELK